MRIGKAFAVAAVLLLAGPLAADADVRLTISDGRVTLKASGATLREILAEWAKVGKTKIVNAERVTGSPVTLELNDVPEQVALEILLRPLSGYVAAPRATAVENASQFDRILVLPTSAPPRAATPPPTFAASPAPFSPQPQPVPSTDDQDGPPQRNPRGPAFSPFPQPQVASQPAPQQGNPQMTQPPVYQPQAQPGGAVGSSVPGMAVPVPQQSEQQAPQPRDF